MVTSAQTMDETYAAFLKAQQTRTTHRREEDTATQSAMSTHVARLTAKLGAAQVALAGHLEASPRFREAIVGIAKTWHCKGSDPRSAKEQGLVVTGELRYYPKDGGGAALGMTSCGMVLEARTCGDALTLRIVHGDWWGAAECESMINTLDRFSDPEQATQLLIESAIAAGFKFS